MSCLPAFAAADRFLRRVMQLPGLPVGTTHMNLDLFGMLDFCFLAFVVHVSEAPPLHSRELSRLRRIRPRLKGAGASQSYPYFLVLPGCSVQRIV
jgi:hypothetical protein